MSLIDIINVTDFIGVHFIISVFEQDRHEFCIDAVRKENSENLDQNQRSVKLS